MIYIALVINIVEVAYLFFDTDNPYHWTNLYLPGMCLIVFIIVLLADILESDRTIYVWYVLLLVYTVCLVGQLI